MNRDAAIEAGAKVLSRGEVHEARCEREWESGAMAWTPCGCWDRAAAAVIDAAAPHLMGEPVGYTAVGYEHGRQPWLLTAHPLTETRARGVATELDQRFYRTVVVALMPVEDQP